MDSEFKFDDSESNVFQFSQPSPRNITFMNEDNKVVGRLTWDDDVFKFEGNAEESAQVFFDCVIALMPVK